MLCYGYNATAPARMFWLIQPFSSRGLYSPHRRLSRRSSTGTPRTTAEQAAHHVEERVALPRPLDAEVHLGDHLQRLVPRPNFRNMRCVLVLQLLEQIGASSLHCKKEQAKEIQEWKAGEDTDIQTVAADILDSKPFVVLD